MKRGAPKASIAHAGLAIDLEFCCRLIGVIDGLLLSIIIYFIDRTQSSRTIALQGMAKHQRWYPYLHPTKAPEATASRGVPKETAKLVSTTGSHRPIRDGLIQ